MVLHNSIRIYPCPVSLSSHCEISQGEVSRVTSFDILDPVNLNSEVLCASSDAFWILSFLPPVPSAMIRLVIPAYLFSVPPAGLISPRYRDRCALDAGGPLTRPRRSFTVRNMRALGADRSRRTSIRPYRSAILRVRCARPCTSSNTGHAGHWDFRWANGWRQMSVWSCTSTLLCRFRSMRAGSKSGVSTRRCFSRTGSAKRTISRSPSTTCAGQGLPGRRSNCPGWSGDGMWQARLRSDGPKP